jgi:hypothetical protein
VIIYFLFIIFLLERGSFLKGLRLFDSDFFVLLSYFL